MHFSPPPLQSWALFFFVHEYFFITFFLNLDEKVSVIINFSTSISSQFQFLIAEWQSGSCNKKLLKLRWKSVVEKLTNSSHYCHFILLTFHMESHVKFLCTYSTFWYLLITEERLKISEARHYHHTKCGLLHVCQKYPRSLLYILNFCTEEH